MTEDSKIECQLRLDSQEKPKLGKWLHAEGVQRRTGVRETTKAKKAIFMYQTTIFSYESIEYDDYKLLRPQTCKNYHDDGMQDNR